MTETEKKAHWLQARQQILNAIAPFEQGSLLYNKGQVSAGATQQNFYKLRKRLAKIDVSVPQEWLTSLLPGLAESLAGICWDIPGVMELIEQYEAQRGLKRGLTFDHLLDSPFPR